MALAGVSSGSWFEKVNLLTPWVDEPAKQAGSAVAGGGGGSGGTMRLEEDELDGIKKELEDILYDLADHADGADTLRMVKPPGDEEASQRVAADMNKSGAGYVNAFAAQQRAVEKLYNAVTAALNDYHGVEDRNADAARQIDQRLGEGGL